MTSSHLEMLAQAGEPREAGDTRPCPGGANSECPQPRSRGCKRVCGVRKLQGEGELVFRPKEWLPRVFNWGFGELLE